MNKLAVFLLALFSSLAHAEAELTDFFAFGPGEVVPLKKNSHGLPFDNFLLPMQGTLANTFQNVELTVAKKTQMITNIGAKKSFSDFRKCPKERDRVIEVLRTHFPNTIEEKWMYSSSNSKVEMQINCVNYEETNFSVLDLYITHLPAKEASYSGGFQ